MIIDVVFLFLLFNGLGLIAIGLVAIAIIKIRSRRPKNLRVWSYILPLLVVLLLGGQYIVSNATRTQGQSQLRAIAKSASFDMYIPSKTINSKQSSVTMVTQGDQDAFVVYYTRGPLDFLYEQSMTPAAFGTQIPFTAYKCDLVRDSGPTPDCKTIGDTKDGQAVFVDTSLYPTGYTASYNVMTKINNTFVGIELTSYVKPDEIITYFDSLKKINPESIQFVNKNNRLLIFP